MPNFSRLPITLIAIVWLGSLVGCGTLRHRNDNLRLTNARELSLRGADALERQRMDDAQDFFSAALAKSSDDERAQWGMAQTLWKRGDRPRAIQHMQQAVKLTSSKSSINTDYLVRLGQMHLEMGDLQQARTQANLSLDYDHKNADVWALLADVERAEQHWQSALEYYDRALLIRPDYPRVQLAVADAYRQLNRPLRALATLDQMADLHPTEHTDPEPLLIRGLALKDLGRNEEAIAALNRSADALPTTDPKLRIQLASAQYRLGDLVQSRMTLGRLLRDHPNDTDALQLQSTLDQSFEHMARPIDASSGTIFR